MSDRPSGVSHFSGQYVKKFSLNFHEISENNHYVGRYKIFSFWTHWPNCGLVVAKNVRGWWFLTIIWNTDHCFVYTGLVSLQKLFDLWPYQPNFGHLVARKWPQLMVSNHYLGYWSRNPLHMWCVHWLGEFSYFWWKLAKFGFSGGRKMAAVGGFGQLFRILIIEITSYWLGEFLKKCDFWPNISTLVAKKWPKLMFMITELFLDIFLPCLLFAFGG